MYRSYTIAHDDSQTKMAIVAPHRLRKEIFSKLHCHKTAAHLGIARTVAKIRQRFYWPSCKNDIRRWCLQCEMCARTKSGRKFKAKLHQCPVGAPLERIAIDICGPLPTSHDGKSFILVVSDYFTKWTEAYSLENQTAIAVADVLVTEFFSRFGIAYQIHSDQGRNFESDLFQELCRLLELPKTRTTPYRPQSDGQVERYNRTMLQMLKTLVAEDHEN